MAMSDSTVETNWATALWASPSMLTLAFVGLPPEMSTATSCGVTSP